MRAVHFNIVPILYLVCQLLVSSVILPVHVFAQRPGLTDSISSSSLQEDDRLAVRADINEDSSSITRIVFHRGKGPFQVAFYNLDSTLLTVEVNRSHWVQSNDSILWLPEAGFLDKRGIHGEVFFKVRETRDPEWIQQAGWRLIREGQQDWKLYLISGIALLLLAGFLIGYYRANRRRLLSPVAVNRFPESHKPSLYGASKATPKQIPVENARSPKKGKVRVKGISKASSRIQPDTRGQAIEEVLEGKDSIRFDPSRLWEETSISSISFTVKSGRDLDACLKQQEPGPSPDQQWRLPEIGGILMGRAFYAESVKTYRVLVEEFVPIEPEYHNNYQLEFSAHSLAKDLGKIQDDFSALLVVGWFHTHPGHGLFLSNQDLRIHDSFFREQYQFAMEIDSLSERLDTGFFTRRFNGQVNNRRNLTKDAVWFSWTEIMKNP